MLSRDSYPSSIVKEHAGPNASREHQEEPEDILSAFLEVVYNHPVITHAEAGSTFSYTYPSSSNYAEDEPIPAGESSVSRWKGDPIRLMIHTPDTQARNWELHASSIWTAAVFLADHLEELCLDRFMRSQMVRESGDGRRQKFRVLELGAGAGLPGLLAAKYLERIEKSGRQDAELVKEWNVTLSDYPDDLLIDNLRDNVRRNGFPDVENSTLKSRTTDRVLVVPYAWGEDVSALCPSNGEISEPPGFDLIIAADTLWNAALHDAFARTLYLLLRRSLDARVHLVAGLHTGRYALSGFLRSIYSLRPEDCIDEVNEHSAKLEVLRITERSVNGDIEREWKVERDNEDEAERRRWVVWIVLGWSTT